MRTNRILHPAKSIFLTVATVIMIFVFNSCATQADFLASPVVPAAQGKVTVKSDGNNNYVIKVNLTDLAESSRLQPPMNAYVVWMVTENNISKNIGQIVSSTGALSNKLKASFETVSSFKPKKIFITAENDADAQYPDTRTVLTTDFIR